MVRRLLLGLAVMVVLGLAAPEPARAAPDPVVASVMSAAATLVPVGVGIALLTTGRGFEEGIRFDFGMGSIAAGSIAGPSVGLIYADGGWDAVITFLLRAVTGSVMLTGLGFKLRGAEERDGLGLALSLVGGVPTGLLALYDVYAAARSAQQSRYEEGHARLRRSASELADVALCGPIPCPVGGR